MEGLHDVDIRRHCGISLSTPNYIIFQDGLFED